jgi:hypothetical protein
MEEGTVKSEVQVAVRAVGLLLGRIRMLMVSPGKTWTECVTSLFVELFPAMGHVKALVLPFTMTVNVYESLELLS